MTTKRTTLTLAALLVTGCAPTYVTKPGATTEQTQRDIWECQREGAQTAQALFGPDGALLFGREYQMQCLVARGYSQQKTP